MTLRGKAAIAGVFEFPHRKASNVTPLQIHAICAKYALEEAGLTTKDVDALFTAGVGGLSPLPLAEYLGIQPTYMDGTSVGGSAFEFHVEHAAAGIAAGIIDVALITYGSTAASQGTAIGTGMREVAEAGDNFEFPYGSITVARYAMAAQRHMYEYGTTSEQLAEIAVAMRRHAGLNPNAMFREPIGVADVLNSRYIAEPLHLLDCCIISDGGGAVALTSVERARDLKRPPVVVMGTGEAGTHATMGQMPSFTRTPAALSGPRAFAMARLGPTDIDLAMIYDSFTITVLMTLEDLGFCKKGEGGGFVSGGRIQLGGELPVNTDGGGLSSNHPGMRGIFLLIEATKQLRDDFRGTERQVPDCNVAVCHGTGGSLMSGGTIILARDAR